MVGKCQCACVYTWFRMSLVCAADRQKRARASVIGVAGKPTTTTPIFLSSISRAKALSRNNKRQTTVFIYSSTQMAAETRTKVQPKVVVYKSVLVIFCTFCILVRGQIQSWKDPIVPSYAMDSGLRFFSF